MTRDKSSDYQYPEASELIRTFLQSIDEAFDYLMSTPKVLQTTEIKVHTKNGLKSIKENELEQYKRSFFYVTKTYTIGEYILCLTYGDREFYINATVSVPRGSVKNEYGLWEWIEALGISEQEVSGNFVGNLERIKKLVNQISDAFQKYIYPLKQVDSNLLLKLEHLRNERKIQYEREFEEKLKRHASNAATRAFRSKDYSKVIELLTPYENDLTPSELKKLKYSLENRGKA